MNVLYAAFTLVLLFIATQAGAVGEIPVTHKADVVVVGGTVGGWGGCCAAVAAAKNGAKVLFVEESGHLDPHVPIGLGIVIGIPGWKPAITEGILKDYATYLVKEGQYYYSPVTLEELLKRGEIIIRYHEVASTAMLKMMEDAGVNMLFHTKFSESVVENGRMTGIIVESPRGRHKIEGKVFIDSTGIGELAASAGAPMEHEEAFMGLQSFISGVDETKYRKWVEENNQPLDESYKKWMEGLVGPFDKLEFPWDQWWPEYLGDRMPPALVRKIREAQEKGEFTLFYRRGAKGLMAIPEGLKTDVNCARPRTYITGIDPSNVDDVTWAETQSRFALMQLYRFLRQNIPGFENCVMERMADSISLRGGRFIKVEPAITAEQIQAGAKNQDCIYVFQRSNGGPFEVPYRALVPQKIEGLLVVGKATGGGASLRTAHGVFLQGQAAGTAAAIAVKSNIPVAKVDIKKLQAEMKKTGVEIPY